MPNEGILIAGDRIEAVGASASAAAEQRRKGGETVRTIDAAGQYILPGLIDSHCHISFAEPASNDEMFFHRQSEGLTAILAGHAVQKVLLAGCTGFLDADVLYNVGADVRDAIEVGGRC